jgi:hypothetical protein
VGHWKSKPGRENDLIEAWKGLGDFFLSLPQPPGPGTLVQSIDDPALFYSFGPWDSIEAIQAMRANPGSRAAIGRLAELCEVAEPGTYRVVATAG